MNKEKESCGGTNVYLILLIHPSPGACNMLTTVLFKHQLVEIGRVYLYRFF